MNTLYLNKLVMKGWEQDDGLWGKASVLGIRLEHVYLLGMDLKEKGEARDTKIRKVN